MYIEIIFKISSMFQIPNARVVIYVKSDLSYAFLY